MDKQAAKTYIANLKEQLGNFKLRHSNDNAQHKRELDNLKSDVAQQSNPGAKQNARIRVESKKNKRLPMLSEFNKMK
jgi:hypothetical protein